MPSSFQSFVNFVIERLLCIKYQANPSFAHVTAISCQLILQKYLQQYNLSTVQHCKRNANITSCNPHSVIVQKGVDSMDIIGYSSRIND